MMHTRTVIFAAALVSLAGLSSAQTPPDYDFKFVTIGDTGNAPFNGPSETSVVLGRGRVDYSYRMSKFEITTAQWMEFVNTYSTQSNDLTFFAEPIFWGATPDPTYHGAGRRWKLDGRPSDFNLPVTGMTWRDTAMYCNWLHNGKGSSLNAIKSGAYDTATFTTDPDTGNFQDQDSRSPGAKYWIPNLDEWLKAVHYDPNHDGPGEGGWWKYCNGSDTKPVPGLPGVGETSAGYRGFGTFQEWAVPLGAYPQTVTPWGLIDATGGACEWVEDWVQPEKGRRFRLFDGAWAGSGSSSEDRIDSLRESQPNVELSFVGFRIASAVPSPGSFVILLASTGIFCGKRRRRPCYSSQSM